MGKRASISIKCPVCGRDSVGLPDSKSHGRQLKRLKSMLYDHRACYSCGIRFHVDKLETLLGMCFPGLQPRRVHQYRLPATTEADEAYDNLRCNLPAVIRTPNPPVVQSQTEEEPPPLLLKVNCRSLGFHMELVFKGIPNMAQIWSTLDTGCTRFANFVRELFPLMSGSARPAPSAPRHRTPASRRVKLPAKPQQPKPRRYEQPS